MTGTGVCNVMATGRFAPSLVRQTFRLLDDRGRILHFLLIQLKPKYHLLDNFNYSCHRVHISCWIKKLLIYLTTRGSI